MDLIDRDALVEELNELYGEQTVSKYSYSRDCKNTRLGIALATNKVKTAPTVDAEPVLRGKWMTKDVGFLQKSLICSACGGWEHNLTYKHECMNYCPQCGAKMDGE